MKNKILTLLISVLLPLGAIAAPQNVNPNRQKTANNQTKIDEAAQKKARYDELRRRQQQNAQNHIPGKNSPEGIVYEILFKDYYKDFYQQYRSKDYNDEEASKKAYEQAQAKALVDCRKKEYLSKYASQLLNYSPDDMKIENMNKHLDMNGQANADLEENVKLSRQGAKTANDWTVQELAHKADNIPLDELYRAIGLTSGETYLNELERTASPQQIENLGRRLHIRINKIEERIRSTKSRMSEYCNQVRLPDASAYRSFNEYSASLDPGIELRDEMVTTISTYFSSIDSANKDKAEAEHALGILGNKFKDCKNCKASSKK